MPNFDVPDNEILKTFEQAFSQRADYSYEMYEKLGDSALNYALSKILKGPPYNLINESLISVSADRIKKTKGLVDMAQVLGIVRRYPGFTGNIYEDMMEALIGIIDAVSSWQGHVVCEFVQNIMAKHAVHVDCSPVPNTLLNRFLAPFEINTQKFLLSVKDSRVYRIKIHPKAASEIRHIYGITLKKSEFSYAITEKTYALHGTNFVQAAIVKFLREIEIYNILVARSIIHYIKEYETSELTHALAALIEKGMTIAASKAELNNFAMYGFTENGSMKLVDVAKSKEDLKRLILIHGKTTENKSSVIRPSNYGIMSNVINLWRKTRVVFPGVTDPIEHEANPKATKSLVICSGVKGLIYWHSPNTKEVFDSDITGFNTATISEFTNTGYTLYYSSMYANPPGCDLPVIIRPRIPQV
jgi:hypothetical protein